MLALAVATTAWFRIGNSIADRRAEAAEGDLAPALDGHTPDDFLGWVYDPEAGNARAEVVSRVSGAHLEGGPVDEFRFSVTSGWAFWEPHCVMARPSTTEGWETRAAHAFCDEARWPDPRLVVPVAP